MSYGLEVFDENGVKFIGINERTARLVDIFEYVLYTNGGQSTRDYNVDGIANDQTWIAFSTNSESWVSIPGPGALRLHIDARDNFGSFYDFKTTVVIMRI